MSRGSFSRSVARAAASGGGRAYGSRRPLGWYALLTVIVVVGIGLVVYSRNERLHPASSKKATVGPTASDHWTAAIAFDICGVIEPNIAANDNLDTVGIRTFGNGLIDMDPSAVPTGTSGYTEANYEGAKVTLGLFADSYPGMILSATSVKIPDHSLYKNGDACTGKSAAVKGKGEVVAWAWSSPKAKGHQIKGDITEYHLTNGAMVTVAFVPKGTKIPEPPSKAALVSALGSAG